MFFISFEMFYLKKKKKIIINQLKFKKKMEQKKKEQKLWKKFKVNVSTVIIEIRKQKKNLLKKYNAGKNAVSWYIHIFIKNIYLWEDAAD